VPVRGGVGQTRSQEIAETRGEEKGVNTKGENPRNIKKPKANVERELKLFCGKRIQRKLVEKSGKDEGRNPKRT